MKHQYYAHKDEWEQARLIAYVTAQVNSTKKIKMSDIIDLYWEHGNGKGNNKREEAVSNEQIKRLREKAQEYAKIL